MISTPASAHPYEGIMKIWRTTEVVAVTAGAEADTSDAARTGVETAVTGAAVVSACGSLSGLRVNPMRHTGLMAAAGAGASPGVVATSCSTSESGSGAGSDGAGALSPVVPAAGAARCGGVVRLRRSGRCLDGFHVVWGVAIGSNSCT